VEINHEPLLINNKATPPFTGKLPLATSEDSWLLIVIILSVLLLLFVVAFFVTLWFYCRVKSELVRIKKSHSPLYNDLNFIQTSNYADLLKRDETYVIPNTNNSKVQSDGNSRISDTNTMYDDVMNYEAPPSNYYVAPSNYEVAPESIK